MKWNVAVNCYGTKEETEVDAETVGEAVGMGLIELGFEDNDEGKYDITVEATDA